tara:strand:+ start:114 stop:656 length:543 start_codon:yes stop_codon:yes gene_type:complete
MPPWYSQFISFQKKERNLKSCRWIQLATVALDNTPRVRTVVFRGWTDSYDMEILTDKRSQKYRELEENNNVEICWLFSKSSCQFRFRGKSKFEYGEAIHDHWKKLNDKSKEMWSWPSPGSKYIFNDKDVFPSNKNHKLIDNFLLIKIEIDHVDQLILKQPMHIRKKWIKSDNWIEQRIYP